MQKMFTYALLAATLFIAACSDDDSPNTEEPETPAENPAAFNSISEITLVGGETAAEISAYDPATKKLFVVNAVSSAIDIIDMTDPSAPKRQGTSLDIAAFGAGVNSVAVKNGLLAAAIEADPKTNPGKVVVWSTADMTVKASPTVGALPDMVVFSADGNYILSANEGEPDEAYEIDPVGSISIIDVKNSYTATTLDFSGFESQADALREKGFRLPGQSRESNTLAKDTEPEYITISADSKTAWVTLQENNAIARINITGKTIENIFPLGFKDHSKAGNELDASDEDGAVTFVTRPVQGIYMPDGIASFAIGGTTYLITANEGDSRIRPTSDDALDGYEEGDLYNEESRIKSVDLDPAVFTDESLQDDEVIGRLKITNTMGDTNSDGLYDKLYTFGARSFSIWNGTTGELVFDSGSQLEKFIVEKLPAQYDDARSDDKGVEPENVTVGKIGDKTLAFVGVERADVVVVVDVTNPAAPQLLQALHTGDAPEGILFISAEDSPTGHSLLVSSCEGDGKVNVFQPEEL
ncbi:choice-of-anchor I family protein [Fulvivirgaceae bacterium PWU5]|uniref:Choice-of-anchor I family protein n=1 Tax=Dawidia cretensis TaxID=2782350 RepID=A0AAP2DW13_9BACT|nr:choice-of-anchor I family protein [Dawidia cretensis]MBT1708421.1 choice-of-anchor I family protein [Dawidia cretensis]